MRDVENEKRSFPPLSQSRYGDMACEILYVRKHVHGLKLGESGPAASAGKHQPPSQNKACSRPDRPASLDSLTGTVGPRHAKSWKSSVTTTPLTRRLGPVSQGCHGGVLGLTLTA
jgi:hypothetical protein